MDVGLLAVEDAAEFFKRRKKKRRKESLCLKQNQIKWIGTPAQFIRKTK